MFVNPLFHDRIEAGQVLTRKLRSLGLDANPLVLALPRGGVPFAYQIAQALPADLDIFLVRKIGVPGREELAMGAIASGGTRLLHYFLILEVWIFSGVIVQGKKHQKTGKQTACTRDPAGPLGIMITGWRLNL